MAPQLGHLGVQGSSLGATSLAALAALPSLRCLSVSVSPNTPHSLTTVTCLSNLTALQVSPSIHPVKHSIDASAACMHLC